MIITSKDNSKIKEIRKLLNDKKYMQECGKFVIEGENLVFQAIKNNYLLELYVLENCETNYGFEYKVLTKDVMKSISDLKSIPRVIGVSRIPNDKKIGNKIVILENIQDPGNAGTIIRSAVAFDVDTIIFSNDSVSPYNKKVLRSTGGMIFNCGILIDDINSIINKIKHENIHLIGTSLRSENSLKNLEKMSKFAIIFGNEGNGIKSSTLDKCDSLVRIDMNQNCESLNVGVSASIVLYHMYK